MSGELRTRYVCPTCGATVTVYVVTDPPICFHRGKRVPVRTLPKTMEETR
jgi:DNA-directed RNA polymerase subunit RPC12/RpoP